jgi:hypothetical protein
MNLGGKDLVVTLSSTQGSKDVSGKGARRRTARKLEAEQLRADAQACARAMNHSPLLGDPTEPKSFEDVVSKSLDDYRSGKALMDHIGAAGLLDPATTGMLLAIRRGLIEETGAMTITDMVLVDMAVLAFANAMRIQSRVGNTSLLIEAEMFGQPSLQAGWKKAHGALAAEIRGLRVDEHVAKLIPRRR